MKPAPIIGTLIVGALIGAGITYALVPHDPSVGAIGQSANKLRSGRAEPSDTDGQAIYTNTHYGFSIKYPLDFVETEYPEGADALTIVFQKTGEESKGFQIFVIPYPETQISQERIKTDLKGAPMKNVTEVILPGNIRAVHFNSVAPIIGDSSEVWFIHNGYLFEVTTYAALDTWLAGVLATMQFSK
jgi:hypothetical protein